MSAASERDHYLSERASRPLPGADTPESRFRALPTDHDLLRAAWAEQDRLRVDLAHERAEGARYREAFHQLVGSCSGAPERIREEAEYQVYRLTGRHVIDVKNGGLLTDAQRATLAATGGDAT